MGVSLDIAPGMRVDASPLGGWLTSGLTGQARGSTARRRQVNKINRPNCGRPILTNHRSLPCFLVEGVPRPQGREWILGRHEHSLHHTHRVRHRGAEHWVRPTGIGGPRARIQPAAAERPPGREAHGQEAGAKREALGAGRGVLREGPVSGIERNTNNE